MAAEVDAVTWALEQWLGFPAMTTEMLTEWAPFCARTLRLS